MTGTSPAAAASAAQPAAAQPLCALRASSPALGGHVLCGAPPQHATSASQATHVSVTVVSEAVFVSSSFRPTSPHGRPWASAASQNSTHSHAQTHSVMTATANENAPSCLSACRTSRRKGTRANGQNTSNVATCGPHEERQKNGAPRQALSAPRKRKHTLATSMQ